MASRDVRLPKKLHPSREPVAPPTGERYWGLVGYNRVSVSGQTQFVPLAAPPVLARTAFAARALLASRCPPEVSTQSVVVGLVTGQG